MPRYSVRLATVYGTRFSVRKENMDENRVEVWFRIMKDADGFPDHRDWELLKCVEKGNVYEVRSVPFYLNNVAYGDRVFVSMSSEGRLEFQAIESRGGYSVFRLWLGSGGEHVIPVLKELVELGLL